MVWIDIDKYLYFRPYIDNGVAKVYYSWWNAMIRLYYTVNTLTKDLSLGIEPYHNKQVLDQLSRNVPAVAL